MDYHFLHVDNSVDIQDCIKVKFGQFAVFQFLCIAVNPYFTMVYKLFLKVRIHLCTLNII